MASISLMLAMSLSLGASGAPSAPAAGRPIILADCGAPAPAIGSRFSGPVLQVLDGRTFCIAKGRDPAQWVRVRLAGADAGEDRRALLAVSFGRRADCTAQARRQGEVVASCAVDGLDLGAQTRTPAARAEAMRWR